MKTVYFNVLSHLSTKLSIKTPEIRFASKKKNFWQKIWYSKIAYYFQEASQEVWKPFILSVYPVSEPNYLQKEHPYFVLLALIIFGEAKNLIFEFCLLRSRGITVGMKTVYFNVLSHLSNDLSTKNTQISLASSFHSTNSWCIPCLAGSTYCQTILVDHVDISFKKLEMWNLRFNTASSRLIIGRIDINKIGMTIHFMSLWTARIQKVS